MEELIGFAAVLMPMMIVGIVLDHRRKMEEMRLKRERELGAGRQDYEELARRVGKIEQRIANLETIVIETEKKREFERSL